jgi:hypothetical protein
LQFVFAAVLEEQHTECGFGKLSERAGGGNEHTQCRQADHAAKAARVLLR